MRDPLGECRRCCYFAETDDPFWNGREHCCFHEWGHGDWETAPCDEPVYEDEPYPYEEFDYEEDGN